MNAVGRRLALACEAAGFALLAIAVRALSWRWQLDGESVVLVGNDAYYHARRTLWSARHFPSTLDVDPYVNFPHGGEPIWAPLLDLTTAMLLRAGGIADDVQAAERVMLWIPPLLGAASVVVVWVAARRNFGPAAARVTAFTLAVLVAHFQYSRIGFFDHHVAVALIGAILLALALELASRIATAPPRPVLGTCLGLGLVGGAGFLVWPGMLFEWALLEVAFLALLLTRSDGAGAARVAAALVALHLLAAAVVAPWAWDREWAVWGAFSPVVLTRFQPWFLIVGALFYALLGLVWRGLGPASRPGRRWGGVVLATSLTVCVAMVLAGDLSGAAEQAWRWLARAETFQAAVRESRPLLARGGLGYAVTQLSLLLPVLPLLLGWCWLQRRDPPGRATVRLLVWWTAAFLAITFMQVRFYASLAVAMALVAGCWVGALEQRLTGRGRMAALLPTLIVLLLLSPTIAYYRAYLPDQLRWLQGEQVELSQLQQRKRILLRLAEWIHRETPATTGWLDRNASPEYAVLSQWTDGHVLHYVARRPTVVDNFGDDLGEENFLLAAEYYRSAEPRASDILDQLGARYTVFEYRNRVSPRNPDPESLLARLFFGDGSETDRSVGRGGPARAVERHRLVWETEAKRWVGPAPAFKVYEHVAGAVLEGSAEHGARVEARLDVETNRGRSFRFVSSTTADPDGSFRLRVPYATGAGPHVRTASRLELRSGDQLAEVSVTDRDTREGLSVRVPSLRPQPSMNAEASSR